jgi:hypothetical protein
MKGAGMPCGALVETAKSLGKRARGFCACWPTQNAMLATTLMMGHSLGRLGSKIPSEGTDFAMTNLERMHSYFWLPSSRLRAPVQEDVPYADQALRQDLLRVRNAWEESQSCRRRDGIYVYLTAVFDLVGWWTAEKRARERAHKALRLRNMTPFDDEDPFAAIIRCTSDPSKVDKRTRSKWSRALRYAISCRPVDEALDQFIKLKGGINKCVVRLTQQTSRRSKKM